MEFDHESEELIVNVGIRKRKRTSSASLRQTTQTKRSRTSFRSSAKNVPAGRFRIVQVPSSLAGDEAGNGDDNAEASAEDGTLIVEESVSSKSVEESRSASRKTFEATSVEKQAETEEQEVVKKKVEVRMLSYVPLSPVAPNSNKADNDNEEEDEDEIVFEGASAVVEEEIEVDVAGDKFVAMRDSEEPAPIDSQLSDAMQGIEVNDEEGDDMEENLKLSWLVGVRPGLRRMRNRDGNDGWR